MFGNVVNKSRLKELIKTGALLITNFRSDEIRTIHYPLRPIRIYSRGDLSENRQANINFRHEFNPGGDPFRLKPDEYVIVEVLERIEMKHQGIVGHFVTPGHFIDRGLGLTAGRIEAPYGQRGEAVRFGIKNNLQVDNYIFPDDTVGFVYFVDLISLRHDNPYKVSQAEFDLFKKWQIKRERAEDDGIPSYPEN